MRLYTRLTLTGKSDISDTVDCSYWIWLQHLFTNFTRQRIQTAMVQAENWPLIKRKQIGCFLRHHITLYFSRKIVCQTLVDALALFLCSLWQPACNIFNILLIHDNISEFPAFSQYFVLLSPPVQPFPTASDIITKHYTIHWLLWEEPGEKWLKIDFGNFLDNFHFADLMGGYCSTRVPEWYTKLWNSNNET